MKNLSKNVLFLLLVSIITFLFPLILSSLDYLKPAKSGEIAGFPPAFVIVFVAFNLILIGIPAAVHWIYTRDYSRMKSVWFFTLFGGIVGALLGEFGNLLMIIPYTILMFIYAQFYKRFAWWKVASTSYLSGIIIENGINRAPLQVTTLIWIGFFICPYFATKIWENRKKINLIEILKDFKFSFVFSIILGTLAVYFSRNNVSPPLVVLGITLPFIISLIYKIYKIKRG